jgi:ribosomal subunit interface protein
MEVGESLNNYIHDRLTKSSNHFLDDVIWAEVILSKNSYLFHADIIIHDGKASTVKASAESDEVYSAFDSALIKIEKLLRKYKEKIISKYRKHKNQDVESTMAGVKYVIDTYNEDEQTTGSPVTIAEKGTQIDTLTVSEAIMKMDLTNVPALLFKNEATERLNVVYYRKDGNISWVDPA